MAYTMTRNHRRAATVGTAFAVASAVLLSGCGEQTATARSDGWGALKTSQVSVAYPNGWTEQSAAARGKGVDAAAVLAEGGKTVGKISVQLNFMHAGDAEVAAGGAMAAVQFGSKIEGEKTIVVPGTDDARRVDYTYDSDGLDGHPAKGTPVTGVAVVGMDGKDQPFLVSINVAQGKLAPADVERVVHSVRVGG